MDQTSTGYWSKADAVVSFFSCEVVGVHDELAEEVRGLLGSNGGVFEEVWLTLLALFVLQNKFKHKQQEWTLIASKAKAFLKQQGLQKPDNFVKKITYPLK